MDELRDLYQQAIIDHSSKPHNHRVIEDADAKEEGHNPLCGDKLTLYLKVKDGVVVDASFKGHGCAIFMASTSIMTDMIKGKSIEEAQKLFDEFHYLVTTGDTAKLSPEYAKLKVLAGVAEFPVRVKCAVLAWHTLKKAVRQ